MPSSSTLRPTDTVHHAPRTTGSGGGLAILHRNSVSVKKLEMEQAPAFESQRVRVSSAGETVEFLSI